LCSEKKQWRRGFKINPTDFQSVLSAVLREQEQRIVLLLDALRVGHSTSVAVAPPAQGNSPLPQLSDNESFVVNVENRPISTIG
jgi:hypothetical protein